MKSNKILKLIPDLFIFISNLLRNMLIPKKTRPIIPNNQ